MGIIRITRHQSLFGEMLLGSYGDNLCICDWVQKNKQDHSYCKIYRQLNAEFEEGDSEIINKTIAQLGEYFAGNRKSFSIPVKLTGTDFQNRVWMELMQIPYGTTLTYRELAHRIDNPKAIRAVASAIGSNVMSIIIPCHRIIGSDNKLTGYRGGLEVKQQLLTLEASISHQIIPFIL